MKTFVPYAAKKMTMVESPALNGLIAISATNGSTKNVLRKQKDELIFSKTVGSVQNAKTRIVPV